MSAFSQAHVRSLATTAIGDLVQIEHILFEGLRAFCAELGIREGDCLRCLSVTPVALVLETVSGTKIALERQWARFIQVETRSGLAPIQS